MARRREYTLMAVTKGRWTLRRMLPTFALLCIVQAGRADPVRLYDTENGLPHNRVNKIYLDSKNFLWVCTDDGLSRFDGYQFVNYTTAQGLPHRHVNGVLETRTGEYWVATDAGLSRFDPRPGQPRFTNHAPSGPEDARHINALIEDTDGSLLIGTSFGLYRFRASGQAPMFERMQFGRSLDQSGAVMVNALAQDFQGSLWLATNDGLFRRTKNAGWEHYGTESGLSVDRWFGTKPAAFANSFAKDANGRLWVAFKGGFGRIARAPRQGTLVLDFVQTGHPALGRGVRALWFGRNGRRWIAAESGFWEWTEDSNGASRFIQHTIQDRFPREAFLSVIEDAAGGLWIGTRRSGLVQLGSSRFETFGISEGLRLGLDQGFLEAKSGLVCIYDLGREQAQVYRWEGGPRFRVIRPALPKLGKAGLQMAIEDHKGAWWFSTPSGLFRSPILGARFDLRLLRESDVSRIFEDSLGDLWITHWPRGMVFAKLARWERRSGLLYDESERLPPDARTGITAFAQDHGGTIWIGLQHPGGRLLRLRNGRFQSLSAKWSGHINCLFVDSKGRLWSTSTESGLGLIADPQSPEPHLHRYTRANGLSADEVWCVTEDRLGRIYVGTAKGVDRVDPDTGRIVQYSTADGLVRGDVRSAIRDRDGNLWFASAHGVSRFSPSDTPTVRPSRVRITDLRASGVPVTLSEFGETAIGPLRIPSHQNSLQIAFAAHKLEAQAPWRYQFRLSTNDRDSQTRTWRDLGTTATAHLVGLASGHFLFEVRAVTQDELAGEPAFLTFSILKPFWQTWWFQLACVMATVGAVGWMRTRWFQHQLALERVRSHIAMDLHDDIGAGLSRIFVMGEVLKSRLPQGDNDTQRMMDNIVGSSRQLIADMGDIVWSLDPGRDRIGDLASRLRAFGSDLLETRGVEWTVEGHPGILYRGLPPALKRQLYLVFREGIHNIAKHAGASKATLRLWLQDGTIRGELTDNGCGIASVHREGNGIPSLRKRLKQLGGHLEISAAVGGGTSVRISVPLSRNA